jgi:[acyl-carrier-protein] S-malonyltransferase
MFEGPESELTLTANAQPALMAVSLAVVRVLERDGGVDLADKVAFVAGHSLGEYSALAAARTLELAQAARLLRRRGQAMQDAVPVGEGAMAALLGAELEVVAEIAAEAAGEEVCALANDNAPGQVVISGHAGAVERAIELAPSRGVRKAMRLSVSAPFHCALMAPAAEAMAEALESEPLRPPLMPLFANVTAEPVSNPEAIRKLLVQQVTGMVRWRESVLAMRAREVHLLAELGAGRVLSGLARRIDRDLEAMAVGAPADIEALVKVLG